MRKWKCIKVNECNNRNFTVGNVYKTDDNMLRCKLDNGCILTKVKIIDEYGARQGLVFEEVFDKKEDIMKFDIKKDKIAVLCNTKEKADKFVENFNPKGGFFRNYEICLHPKNLKFFCINGNLTWDSENYTYLHKYQTITFEEFMGENKENEMEFKVGDRVEILSETKQRGWWSGGSMKKYIGTKGIIVNFWNDEPKYRVKCDLDNNYWFFNKEDLKLSSNIQPQQFAITVSDSITTLETNGKKVEIKRYHTDKHDVEFAIQEVVDKYFEGVRKEERDAKLPKVGDRVRVVDNGLTYSIFSEWLIQNNVSIESAIKWENGKHPKNNDRYTIEMIVDGKVLIEDENNAYIIGIEGLEVVK